MKVWIIIATLNRSEELSKYTLDSLIKQNNHNFEVIVCDASDNDLTKCIVEKTDKINITYYKAPRKGLALQRNDSIDFIKATAEDEDIAVFLDDDVVLSEDAISGVVDTFDKYNCSGVGIPLINPNSKNQWFKNLIKIPFLNWIYATRHMTKYCHQYKPINEKNGAKTNWLSGCGMAYRFYCFKSFSFEERLNRFGGYCLGEDALFSYLIFLEYGYLRLANYGNLQHIKSPNSRINYENLVASYVYNRRLMFNIINSKTAWLKLIFLKFGFFWNSIYIYFSLWFKAIKDHSYKSFKNGMKKGKIKYDE